MKRTIVIAVVAVVVYQFISGLAVYRSASATMSARVAAIEEASR